MYPVKRLAFANSESTRVGRQIPSGMMDLETESSRDGAQVMGVGLFDAHCHPTDIMSAIENINTMRAKALTIMATRSQDQDLVAQVASDYALQSRLNSGETDSCKVIPAFGWHPWFSYQLYDDRNQTFANSFKTGEHYRRVLNPKPDDEELVNNLPPSQSLSRFLEQTEERLRQHPFALVGEIGLDRAFRLPIADIEIPPNSKVDMGKSEGHYTPGAREGRPLSPYKVDMEHQISILRAQLQLAGKLYRPVSVHCVQAYGVILEILQDLWVGHERPSKRQQKKDKSVEQAHAEENSDAEIDAAIERITLPYPPRVCLHSYSGSVDLLKQFLNPRVPADFYFSFSTIINFSTTSSEKVTEVIKALPDSRILIESDYHCAGERMDEMLVDITRKICDIRGWSLTSGSERLKQNWNDFIFGK